MSNSPTWDPRGIRGSELAEPAGISLTGMKKHLRVLEEAGLLSTEKVGRTRVCSLGPKRLEDVQAWVDSYRSMVEERFDRLGGVPRANERG